MESKLIELELLTSNDSENKGKEVETAPNTDSKKRKLSSSSNDSSFEDRSSDDSSFEDGSSDDSSSNESSPRARNCAIGTSTQKGFSCKFCNKNFLSPQALGGHQNAHKKERALAKGEENMNGCGPSSFQLYLNMGYVPPYYYPNPYRGLDFLGWNNFRVNPPQANMIPQRIPIQGVSRASSNMMPEVNEEICAEYDRGQEIGTGSSNSDAIDDQEGSKDENQSVDLTLKL